MAECNRRKEFKKAYKKNFKKQNKEATAQEIDAQAEAFADEFLNRTEFKDGRLQAKFTPLDADPDIETDPISASMVKMNEMVASFAAKRVLPPTIKIGRDGVEAIDKWAEENVPLYTITKDVTTNAWESNRAILAMRTYVNPVGTGLYKKLNALASIAKEAEEDNIQRMTETYKDLTETVDKYYKADEIEKVDDVVAKAGIFGLGYKDNLSKLVAGEVELDDLITELEKEVTSDKLKLQARELARVYLGKPKEQTEQLVFMNNSELKGKSEVMDALTSAYALRDIEGSVELLRDMYTNKNDMYVKLVGLASNIQRLSNDIKMFTNDSFKGRGNFIDDMPTLDYEIVAVTKEDIVSHEFSEIEKFEVLRAPTDTSLGLAYRKRAGSLQNGLGINVSYIKNGISVYDVKHSDKYQKVDKTLVYNGDTPVLYLTAEEKKSLSYENHPVKSLVRSYAHKYLIMETQAVRNEFLNSMTVTYDKSMDIVNVGNEIKESIEKEEHPVFLNLGELEVNKLPKEFFDKYQRVDKSILSDIGGFKNKVQYVRKDVAFYVEGYREGAPFKRHDFNRIFQTIRDIIVWAKTNTIIVNPVKITADFTSGISLAASRGASLQEITKYGKEAVKYSKEMSELRNKRIDLKTRYFMENNKSRREKIKERLDKVEDDIAKHPFSGALANGFINSLSTEMLAKERDALQGLNVRIDNVIEKLTKDESGEFTKFNNLIKKFSSAGVNVETILAYVADKIEDTSSGAGIAKVLNDVSKDLEKAKSKEDMTKYISNLLLTPNSPFVRLGSAATLYADLIPRWIMYRHLINTGVSESDAAIEALQLTLDYKMNMPPELKFLSDLYLVPFPSFFVRIQRVILNLAEKNPVSLTGNLLFNELTGIQGVNILQSNIFTKWEKNSIFTNTFDIVTPSNMIPFSNAIPF